MIQFDIALAKLSMRLVLVSLFGSSAFLSNALAGECKVKDPKPEVIVDAIKMGGFLNIAMTKLAHDHMEKTGKELRVALVARAGQNLKNVMPLRDVDRRGRVLSVSDMVQAAMNQLPVETENQSPNQTRSDANVKSMIQKLFEDPDRSIDYSHFGLIFWNHPDGSDDNGARLWWFRHMLRPCLSPEEIKNGAIPSLPELYDEGVDRFFVDDPYELRAEILVPPVEIQERLEKLALPKKVMIDGKWYMDSRIPRIFRGDLYNAAASWKNKKEANSNQWLLELFAAATQPVGRVKTRAEAQQLLAETGYRPTRALMFGMQKMASIPLASKIEPGVVLHREEQPFYQSYGLAEIITTLSIKEWMQRNDWLMLEGRVNGGAKTGANVKAESSPESNPALRGR